jgi:hypothetical protein
LFILIQATDSIQLHARLLINKCHLISVSVEEYTSLCICTNELGLRLVAAGFSDVEVYDENLDDKMQRDKRLEDNIVG